MTDKELAQKLARLNDRLELWILYKRRAIRASAAQMRRLEAEIDKLRRELAHKETP